MSNLQDRVKNLSREIEALKSDNRSLMVAVSGVTEALARAEEGKMLFKGLEKAYLKTIKVSDGLVSARPSTLKQIKLAEAQPDALSVAKAKEEIQKHLEEIKRQSAKDARFGEFQGAVNKLCQKLDKLLG